MTELYIDADACPVKDEVYRAAGKYGLTVHVVCNARMRVPQHERIRLVVVKSGMDAADDWIAERVRPGDIVVTADIPLADRCIKQGARVLDTRGGEFTEDSIGNAVAMRTLMDELRNAGMVSGGPAPFEKKFRAKFVSKLHQVIQAQLRGEGMSK